MAAVLIAIANPFTLIASIPLLIPPKEWKILPPKKDHPVIIGFLSKEKHYPPSMNLSLEKCSLTTGDYVEAVKMRVKNQSAKTFRDLGTLNTKAGIGRLIQIENKTPHGLFRVIQCFVKGDEKIHIVTAALHEKHFIKHFPSVKQAMESFEIVPYLYEENSKIAKKISDMSLEKTSPTKKIKSLDKYLAKTYPAKGIYWKLLVLAKFQKTMSENSSLQ